MNPVAPSRFTFPPSPFRQGGPPAVGGRESGAGESRAQDPCGDRMTEIMDLSPFDVTRCPHGESSHPAAGRSYDRFSTCRSKGPLARGVPVARLPTPDHSPSSVRPPCRWPHVSFRQPEKLAPPKHSRRSPASDRLSTFPALPSRPPAAAPRNQKPTPPPRHNKTCLDRKPSLTRLSVQPANPCRGFLP